MGDGPGLADHRPRRGQRLDDPGPGLGDRAPDQLAVVGSGRLGVVGRPARVAPLHREQGSVTTDDVRVGSESSRHQSTSVVSPKVQIMAIPEPFSGSASSWASTGTRTPNRGVRDLGAEQGAEAVVTGMGDQGDAGGQQFGPGGLDLHVPRAAGTREASRW